MWEPQSEGWTVLAPRGDVPNERWGHAAALWGGQLVVCLGTDDGGETNTISMLSLDTLSWDAWDGSGVTRSGQATALVGARPRIPPPATSGGQPPTSGHPRKR